MRYLQVVAVLGLYLLVSILRVSLCDYDMIVISGPQVWVCLSVCLSHYTVAVLYYTIQYTAKL